MRSPMLALLLSGAALSCSGSLAPNDLLVGTWSNASTSAFYLTLSAAATGATLKTPCWTARFGPLPLSDSLTFRETGVVTQAGGLVTVRVGDPYTITGRVLGDRLLVGQDTLAPGPGVVHVCNA